MLLSRFVPIHSSNLQPGSVEIAEA
jgi:hypothetical protein